MRLPLYSHNILYYYAISESSLTFKALEQLGLFQESSTAEAFPSLSSDIQRMGWINLWINAVAEISGVAVWLNQQHHSVTTPDPLILTPQLRGAVIQF